MPIDMADVVELAGRIWEAVQFSKSDVPSLGDSARKELAKNAERLAIAVREPEENLYFQATQTAQNSAIRTAIDMGVFEKIPFSGDGITLDDLSAALGIDKRLLARILRACTSTHLLEEVSVSRYVHNAFSSTFTHPANRDMFKQMYDFLGQGVYSMPRFLKSTKYQNPTDYNHSAFQYGHCTSLGFWEYLADDPERAKVFNNGMQSLSTIGDGKTSAGSYPFDQELATKDISETDVAIVDVGGGRGQALMAIKDTFPTLQGKFVLQDVPSVIGDAKAQGLPSFIEPVATSFFDPQPVKGALVYHFRRIFHDWSDDVSLAILRNTVEAMGPCSRILIIDVVVPEKDVPRHVALQDINMMCFGGMERTRLQWKSLTRAAGLEIKRFWSDDKNLQHAIEAKLKK